jgi:hypothetical protein
MKELGHAIRVPYGTWEVNEKLSVIWVTVKRTEDKPCILLLVSYWVW